MILIRLAAGLSQTEEQEHIESLLKRISKAFVRMRSKVLVDPFRPLVEGKQSDLAVTVSSGRRYRFVKEPGKRFHTELIDGGWLVCVPEAMEPRRFHRELWHLISLSELREMTALVDAMNHDSLALPVTDVRLRFATSKWGSCSGSGTVMLNSALLFTPRETLHYVIAHELAHIKHANHSARFWETVGTIMPGYEAAKDVLNEHRLPKL